MFLSDPLPQKLPHRPAPGLHPLLPLETPRLRLRTFRPDDAEVLYQLHRDPYVTRYAGGTRTREQSLASLERIVRRNKMGFGALLVEERVSREAIGWSGIQILSGTTRYEIIYTLKRSVWGKGFATEAAAALLFTAFELRHLQIDEIFGLVYPQNIRSMRVIEKIGMTFVEDIFDQTSRRYACLYSVRRANFFRSYILLQKD